MTFALTITKKSYDYTPVNSMFVSRLTFCMTIGLTITKKSYDRISGNSMLSFVRDYDVTFLLTPMSWFLLAIVIILLSIPFYIGWAVAWYLKFEGK